MIILHDDLLKDGSLTPSSEASGFPAINVQHPHLSRVWRSDTDSGEYIVIDFGAAVSVDAAAIIGHNLTSAATVRVEANSSDSWATPPFMRGFNPEDELMMTTFPSVSYQFWRFYFDDGSNPDTYIEIGRLFLCVHWASEEPIDASYERSTLDTTKITESITGQAFADLGVRTKSISLSLGYMHDAERVALEAIVQSHGMNEPLIVAPHEKVEPLYARFSKIPSFSQFGAFDWRDDTLQFKEAK